MTVTQEGRGRILVVRIEREHKRNAIGVEAALGIDAALNRSMMTPRSGPACSPAPRRCSAPGPT